MTLPWRNSLEARAERAAPKATLEQKPVPGGWTVERIELLKALWIDGLSCSQIAEQLNEQFQSSFSRNAVIGKAVRLKLDGRRAPTAPGKLRTDQRAPPVRAGTIRIANNNLHVEPEPQASIQSGQESIGRRDILTIRAFECRWPFGDPQADDFTLCGAKADGSRPYCAIHSAIAYQTPPEGRRTGNQLMRGLRRYV
jgi:GcrA cell cycle regulator